MRAYIQRTLRRKGKDGFPRKMKQVNSLHTCIAWGLQVNPMQEKICEARLTDALTWSFPKISGQDRKRL